MNRRFLFGIVIVLTALSTASSSAEDEKDEENLKNGRISYNGSQLWRTNVDNDIGRKTIITLRDEGHISTWGGGRSSLDILVKPDSVDIVEEALRNNDISYEIVIPDLQEAIDSENPAILEENDDRKGHRLTWKAYHRAEDIWGYLDYLNQTFPDLCSVVTIGTTHYNRPIKLLKISNGNPFNRAVFIDGGIHAREWISPAAVTYIINHLTSGLENEPDYMQNIDYYIVPLVNPDGYEYTHTADRIWRKNTIPTGIENLPGKRRCFGVDLNRNFGHHWGAEGVSKDPCKETYGGTGPFSELESKAVKQFIEGSQANWKAYISFHSYGQYILYPWGYRRAVTPDHRDLDSVGRKAAAAIRESGGPPYTVGPAASTLYPAAGGSDDWAKGDVHMKYAYTIELRDNGRYGFILPASLIKESAKDAVAAVRVIIEAVSKLN